MDNFDCPLPQKGDSIRIINKNTSKGCYLYERVVVYSAWINQGTIFVRCKRDGNKTYSIIRSSCYLWEIIGKEKDIHVDIQKQLNRINGKLDGIINFIIQLNKKLNGNF